MPDSVAAGLRLAPDLVAQFALEAFNRLLRVGRATQHEPQQQR